MTHEELLDVWMAGMRRMEAAWTEALKGFSAVAEQLAAQLAKLEESGVVAEMAEFVESAEALEVEEPVCESCGEAIVRPEYQTVSRWLQRRFCSRRCANLANTHADSAAKMARLPDRTCDHCGKVLVRHGEPGAWRENLKVFAARRYCNYPCFSAARPRKATPTQAPRPVVVAPKPPARRKFDLFSISGAGAAVEPWSPPPPKVPVAVMVPDGEVERCELHGDVLGYYGCPACNAAEKWRARDRVVRPGGEQLW